MNDGFINTRPIKELTNNFTLLSFNNVNVLRALNQLPFQMVEVILQVIP